MNLATINDDDKERSITATEIALAEYHRSEQTSPHQAMSTVHLLSILLLR
jgi:hypothetical protein